MKMNDALNKLSSTGNLTTPLVLIAILALFMGNDFTAVKLPLDSTDALDQHYQALQEIQNEFLQKHLTQHADHFHPIGATDPIFTNERAPFPSLLDDSASDSSSSPRRRFRKDSERDGFFSKIRLH